MSDSQNKICHYRVYMKMYGEMMQDLSYCNEYIAKLIERDKLNGFEQALCTLIEKSPKH